MVFKRKWVLIKECIKIIMEGVKEGGEVKKIEDEIIEVKGVE